MKGGGGKPKQLVVGRSFATMVTALAAAAVGNMGHDVGPPDLWDEPAAHRRWGRGNLGRRAPAWYKGSRWAKRATARGGNPAAHSRGAYATE